MILNEKILEIQEKLNLKPEVKITYFIPDSRKKGGKYVTVAGKVRKIDQIKQLIVFEDKKEIPIQEIIEITNIEEIFDK